MDKLFIQYIRRGFGLYKKWLSRCTFLLPRDWDGNKFHYNDYEDVIEIRREEKSPLSHLDIYTMSLELFTGDDSAKMAYLIHRRFGKDFEVSHQKYKNLLRNNCSAQQFDILIQRGKELFND